MLVLSRKSGQIMHIYTSTGEKIRIIVNDMDGYKVSLAFDAPLSVKIVRAEIDRAPQAYESYQEIKLEGTNNEP